MMELKPCPFIFDPFAIAWTAFKRLYPEKNPTVFWHEDYPETEGEELVYGFTDFQENGEIYVCVSSQLRVLDAIEVLCHELAHVAVGSEDEHGSAWENAFDAIHDEYNAIAEKLTEEWECDT